MAESYIARHSTVPFFKFEFERTCVGFVGLRPRRNPSFVASFDQVLS